eukprot:scaffold1.g5310.t1
MAVGKLQSCVNDGATAEPQLQCTKKIVATVTLENNKLYETEQLRFGLKCLNSPTDECPCPCDYTTDPICKCRDLEQEMIVAATKSSVSVLYPVMVDKLYNGRPYEILRTKCRDGERDANPTCGWARAKDSNGYWQDIPDSQGFCCRCDTAENWGFKRAYRVGTYQLGFSVALNVTTAVRDPALNGTGTAVNRTSEVVRVDPSAPFAADSTRALSAKLLGDLESYGQIADLSDKYLFVPIYPNEGPQEFLSRHREEWMIVEPTLVTQNGLECDKIGVSYTAFRNAQANRCQVAQGSCLRNQLYDMYWGDVDRMKRGLGPLYLIGRYGGGNDNTNQMVASQIPGGLQLSLSLPIATVKTSLLTITVKADDVVLVTNRSPAVVCTYNAACGGFETLATSGYLHAEISNVGYIAADYTVSVVNCTAGVLPVLVRGRECMAQFASIGPQSTRRFTFELKMETDQAIGNATCTVAVTDSTGGFTATSDVNFYTNATQYEELPQQSDLSGKETGPGSGPPKAVVCGECSSMFAFACTLRNACYMRLAKGLGTIAGALAGLTLLGLAAKQGWLVPALRALLSVATAVVSGLIGCCFKRAATTQGAGPAPAGAAASGKGQGKEAVAASSKGKSASGQNSDEAGPSGTSKGPGGIDKAKARPRLSSNSSTGSGIRAGGTALPHRDALVEVWQAGGGSSAARRGSSFLQQAGEVARRSWNAAAERAQELLQAINVHQNPLAHSVQAPVEAQPLMTPAAAPPDAAPAPLAYASIFPRPGPTVYQVPQYAAAPQLGTPVAQPAWQQPPALWQQPQPGAAWAPYQQSPTPVSSHFSASGLVHGGQLPQQQPWLQSSPPPLPLPGAAPPGSYGTPGSAVPQRSQIELSTLLAVQQQLQQQLQQQQQFQQLQQLLQQQ